MSLKLVSFFLFLTLISNSLLAGTVKKIEVQGNSKIESDAILNKVQIKVGESLDSAKVSEDIRALFAMGYFFNISVFEESTPGGVKLIYKVKEKPVVEKYSFNGNSAVSDTDIQEAVELKEFEILNHADINSAIEKIEKLYEDKGYFLARVKSNIKNIKKGDKVEVEFDITENSKVKVEQVRILGNAQLPKSKIKSVMFTKEGGFFSFMGGSGSFKQEAFDQDIKNITFIYLDAGFVKVKVLPPEVYVTPDKKAVYVTIRIQEGDKYTLSSVDFSGDLLFSSEELKKKLRLDSGDVFSYGSLQKDLKSIQAKYGDLGYAYANPIPKPRINQEDKTVDLVYDIDKGYKVYFGKFTVKGNLKTRDKVLRRELTIYEGELYNETKKRESKANISRLGYFDGVEFVPKTPKGKNDIQDIEIRVEERNTGTIQLGAGFQSNQGFVLNGTVNQINLFGKGQSLGASINWAKSEQLFNLNFTEPYFRDTRWLLGVDVYRKKRTLLDYKEERTGGGIRAGHPLAPYLRGILGYKLDDTQLERRTQDPVLFPVETTNGITSALTGRLRYDKRNDRFFPTKGIYADLFLEYAGVGGDRKYSKGTFTFRYYKNIFWDVVWRNNFEYGIIKSNVSGKAPPFDKLFLLGGANTLRGYDWFTVGKRVRSEVFEGSIDPNLGLTPEEKFNLSLRPFGGQQQVFYQSELQFPLIKEAKILGVTFFDIGYADDSISLDDLRSDVGFGFRWYSPVGPLRFEWGFPLDRKEELGEDSVNFQFAIGSPF